MLENIGENKKNPHKKGGCQVISDYLALL
jgi:hypothetical protein